MVSAPAPQCSEATRAPEDPRSAYPDPHAPKTGKTTEPACLRQSPGTWSRTKQIATPRSLPGRPPSAEPDLRTSHSGMQQATPSESGSKRQVRSERETLAHLRCECAGPPAHKPGRRPPRPGEEGGPEERGRPAESPAASRAGWGSRAALES